MNGPNKVLPFFVNNYNNIRWRRIPKPKSMKVTFTEFIESLYLPQTCSPSFYTVGVDCLCIPNFLQCIICAIDAKMNLTINKPIQKLHIPNYRLNYCNILVLRPKTVDNVNFMKFGIGVCEYLA